MIKTKLALMACLASGLCHSEEAVEAVPDAAAEAKIRTLVEAWEKSEKQTTETAEALTVELVSLGQPGIRAMVAALEAANARKSLAASMISTALIRLKAKEASAVLARIAVENPDMVAQTNALKALRQIGDHTAVPILLRYVTAAPEDKKESDKAKEAQRCLQLTTLNEVMDTIAHLARTFDGASTVTSEIGKSVLSAPDWTRLRYIYILKNVTTSTAEDILMTYVSSNNIEIRTNAIMALGTVGGSRTPQRLVGFLGATDRPVLTAACIAVGNLKYLPAIPRLIELLSHKEPDVVAGAVSALRSITGMPFPAHSDRWKDWYDEQAAQSEARMKELESRLRTTDDKMLPVIIEQMAHIPLLRDKFFLNLKPYIEHPEPRVRAACCNVLAHSADKNAMVWLAQKIMDQSPIVSYGAWRALKNMTGENLPREFVKWKLYLDSRS